MYYVCACVRDRESQITDIFVNVLMFVYVQMHISV